MKAHRFFLLLSVAVGLVLAGCSTPETRIKANIETFNRLEPAQQELIKKGEIALGFTADAARLALGEPDHIRIKKDASGEREVWIYTTWETPSGVVLYQGWYHRYYHAYYPFYMETASRRERDHLRVTFQDGKVVSIEKETR